MEALPGPRPKRIPAKIKRAIDAIVRGEVKNITQAAELVGYSREHLSRELHKPHIQTFFQDKVRRTVTLASGRAAARLTELLDAASEHVSLDASKHALAVAGIKPAPDSNMNISIEQRAGFIIRLVGDDGKGEVIVGGDDTPAPSKRE